MIDFEAPSSQRAIEALREGAIWDRQEGRPWVPERGSLKAHLRIVMYDLSRNRRRSARARREVLDPDLDSIVQHATRPADEQLADARERARLEDLGRRLRADLVGRALEVFDRRCQGIEGTALAAACGCTDNDVHAANQQIAYYAQKLLEEERREVAARMRTLRAGATPKDLS